VLVVGADAESLNGASRPDDVGATPDAEHLITPLAGEDAIRVVPVLDLHEPRRAGVPSNGAVEGEVAVLSPVRQRAVLPQRHLLELVVDVGVRARHALVVAPVVRDVEVQRVLRLAEVRRRGPHVAHQHAHLGVHPAEGARVEVAQPLHVGDERRYLGHGDAEAGLVEERSSDAGVPRAGGEEEAAAVVVVAVDARP